MLNKTRSVAARASLHTTLLPVVKNTLVRPTMELVPFFRLEEYRKNVASSVRGMLVEYAACSALFLPTAMWRTRDMSDHAQGSLKIPGVASGG